MSGQWRDLRALRSLAMARIVCIPGAKRNGEGVGGYQTWWRSGRDSNSRRGYARYCISSADSGNRLIEAWAPLNFNST
jgi:hypothetical protein